MEEIQKPFESKSKEFNMEDYNQMTLTHLNKINIKENETSKDHLDEPSFDNYSSFSGQDNNK